MTGGNGLARQEDDAVLRPGISRAWPWRSRAFLGVKPSPTTFYEFANGEIFVRFEESVRGCDAFVIQSHASPINQWIMEQLIMVDALKRASAKRITAVAPSSAMRGRTRSTAAASRSRPG